MSKKDKIENTSKKVSEIIAVLRILLENTSKKHTLKKNEIMDIAKKDFGIEIEQRRCADILDAFHYILGAPLLEYDSNPFLNTNGSKLYRDSFLLSGDDIDLIIEILGQSTTLSQNECDKLKDRLSHLASYGHQISRIKQNEKPNTRVKEFRELRSKARKQDKSDNGARLFEIDLDSITSDQIYVYPKITLTKKMKLRGFVMDVIDVFHNEPYVCLLVDLSKEYRVLVILPISKAVYSKPKNDWGLDDMKLNLSFLYGNNKKYEDVYEAIEEYKQGKGDILFNFEIRYKDNDGDKIGESHDKIVKEALKRFYPSQFSKMKFIHKKDGFVHAKFKSTINHFCSFYLSNINLLGCVGLLQPNWMAAKLSTYADLMHKNNSTN